MCTLYIYGIVKGIRFVIELTICNPLIQIYWCKEGEKSKDVSDDKECVEEGHSICMKTKV